MALDGIYLYSLINELKNSIINTKIDKINQPEKDEIILTLRGKEQKKLLISSSSNYPRIHFTTVVKNNPLQPPVFCMLLRKYLIGGRIINLSQESTDRIVFIDIENKDELGFDSIYTLIVEIMARHSNITLVRKRDNKVMESIKHITANKNSFRVLYPGVTYVLPPVSNKINPFNFSLNDLSKNFKEINENINDNIFSLLITGVGKNLSKYLFFKFNLIYNQNFNIENLYNFINSIFK
ncbi:NFACT family protein, partial [Clostridium tarantellae]